MDISQRTTARCKSGIWGNETTLCSSFEIIISLEFKTVGVTPPQVEKKSGVHSDRDA